MNLNEIRLPLAAIAGLYQKSLVELPVITNASSLLSDKEITSDSFQYMGNNLKQTLIVVYYPDQPFLPNEQFMFLTAVLKACDLTLEDIAIVNFATFKSDFNFLRQRMLPRVMLFFGVSAEFITVLGKLTEFEQTELEGTATLYVPEIERLNQNNKEGKILKKKLWSALKQLFHGNGD